jgi:hypothetical protein
MSTTDYANGGIPKTIEELKDYCERNGFTPSKTRFFVGFDYTGAKAFGIYKDDKTGEFVVYKNKADGSRAIRYRGTDEEFAVVELYDRLQSEIANQKLRYAAEMAERERNKYERSSSYTGMPESIRNFHIEDHPVRSGIDFDMDESYEGSSSGRSGSSGNGDGSSRVLTAIISIIVWILVVIFGLGGVGGGGSSSYGGSRYESSYDYDSGWSSDSWDSGYTDWDSDW